MIVFCQLKSPLVLCFLTATLLFGCVGNREVVLLQDSSLRNSHKEFVDQTIQNDSIKEYTLKTGDVIYIRIEKYTIGEDLVTLSGFGSQTQRFQVDHPYLLGYKVNQSGEISVPSIGELVAAGLTIDELSSNIEKILVGQHPGATAQVFLLDGTITVLGEVGRPGKYPIFKNRNSVFDILATSGGFLQYADRKSVKIIRTVDSSQEIIHIDLTNMDVLKSKVFYLIFNG
jgi:polysaccharide export outer membrane protein